MGLVLLLARSNLANLLLVRGISRTSEMAVRQALGAGAGRVARLFLVESLLLAALGGAAGLLLARALVALLARAPLPLPGGVGLDVALDHRVLAFGTAIALGTGVLFGLAPALRSARLDVAGALREEHRSGGGRGVSLLRATLVGVQVAVSVVLLVGAALMGRSLSAMRGIDPGFDSGRVAMIGTSLAQGGVDPAETPVVVEEIVRRVEALPGVGSVAVTSRLPAQPGGSTTTVVEGFQPPSGTGSVELPFAVVSPGGGRGAGRLVAGPAGGRHRPGGGAPGPLTTAVPPPRRAPASLAAGRTGETAPSEAP